MFLFSETTAQNNFPPAYELKSDTGVYVPIDDSHWQMLEDHKGEWTVEQVKQPPISNDFHANDSNVNGVDYRTHFYWLRYRLKNTTSKTVDVVLLDMTKLIKLIFFYLTTGTPHHTTRLGYFSQIRKKMA